MAACGIYVVGSEIARKPLRITSDPQAPWWKKI